MTRGDNFKEGDALYYQNGRTEAGVLLLGERLENGNFILVAYKHPHDKVGYWTEDHYEREKGWDPNQTSQAVWPHEKPDEIWADYCAWRLTQ